MTLLEAIRNRLEEAGQALRSLPIIKELWEKIRPAVTTPARRSEGLDFVLGSGYSIAQAAALMNPGQHGPVIVTQQRQIEGELRSYTISLEARLLDLQRTAAQAAGAGAVRAVALDQRIEQLEKERDRLQAKVAQLLAMIAEMRRAQAESEAKAKAPTPAATPARAIA
jgi:predicted ribosome quality control (RQC) complex YloA/Tae2 family protein